MTQRLIAIFFLLAGLARAQVDRGLSDSVRQLRIRVAFSDSACDSSTRVTLVGNMGVGLGESAVNGECVAEFFDVPSGWYRVTIKGPDARNADNGNIHIDPLMPHEVEVRATHTRGSDMNGATAGASFVTVKDLQMPTRAAKEFDKANQLIEKRDWEKAYVHLRKGLAEYSQFAAGYNNLGAIYVHLGKLPLAEEALQKAIALDDRLGAAYVNLARIRFLQEDYSGAESYFDKAIEVAPIQNSDELSLLAYAELADTHLSQAIATSNQGHAMQLKQHAYLHLVAARAYERQAKISDSISELRTYLIEQPSGEQSAKVRSAISTMEKELLAR